MHDGKDLLDSLVHTMVVGQSADTYRNSDVVKNNGLLVDVNFPSSKRRYVGGDNNPIYPDIIVWKPDFVGSSKGKVEELRAKRNAIEAQIKENLELQQKKYRITTDNIEDICRDILDDLRTVTDGKKQKYMEDMIESIYVKERNEAIVNGYIPLYTQAQNIQDEPKRRNRWASKCGEEYTL